MFPIAMPLATERNTSPVSALLRVLAMSENRLFEDIPTSLHDNATDRQCLNVRNDVAKEALCNARDMLKPIDEWMSLVEENQTSLILRKSLLVTSTGLAATKDEEDEEASQTGSSVKDLLGRFHIIMKLSKRDILAVLEFDIKCFYFAISTYLTEVAAQYPTYCENCCINS